MKKREDTRVARVRDGRELVDLADVVDQVDFDGRDCLFLLSQGVVYSFDGWHRHHVGVHDLLQVLRTDMQSAISYMPRSGYLPQRLPTAVVTASRMASWRIAHWN